MRGALAHYEAIFRAHREAGNEGAAQRTVASIPSPTLAVPASLQASLMARLDRLGSAKEVAQIGAAIGRLRLPAPAQAQPRPSGRAYPPPASKVSCSSFAAMPVESARSRNIGELEKLKPILGPIAELEVTHDPRGSRTTGDLTVWLALSQSCW